MRRFCGRIRFVTANAGACPLTPGRLTVTAAYDASDSFIYALPSITVSMINLPLCIEIASGTEKLNSSTSGFPVASLSSVQLGATRPLVKMLRAQDAYTTYNSFKF